ncbi:hypothetical protein V6N11_015661 [Hibiscus sabdariffa]|uniref:Uncharacterized protein n=1 Tax=Hibiscus sabdariffa TaxID=183260 RepID=A0ABR2TSS1_9ROSI
MDCDGSIPARKPVSYKDIVAGHFNDTQDSDFVDLDDDIDLLEDDVSFGSLNGIPTIDFSERVQNLAVKSMDLTLVVKDNCPKLQQHDSTPPPQPETLIPAATNSVPDESYGPWMLVERRKRFSRASNSTIHAPKGSNPFSPSLNPIFESNANPQDNPPDSRDVASEPILAMNPKSDIQGSVHTAAPTSDSDSHHLHVKMKSTGKSIVTTKKTPSFSLLSRKSMASGVKVSRHSHGTSTTSLVNSRSSSHQHVASSSTVSRVPSLLRSNSGPPVVILDPSKHQAVTLPDDVHPCIPTAAVSGGQPAHGSVAMLE